MNCCGLRLGALRWLQVPFEQVPDLVASRRVLLRGGWAFVSRHEVASLVVGRFRAGLSHALVLTARRWAMQLAEEEADRLTPLISTLSERQDICPLAQHLEQHQKMPKARRCEKGCTTGARAYVSAEPDMHV